MERTTRTTATAIAALLVLSACASTDDDASDAPVDAAPATDPSPETTAPATTAAPTTTAPPATAPPTTAPAATAPPSTESVESAENEGPPVNTSPDGVRLLDFQFQPVPPGDYRVETLGAPFTITIPEGWFVQPNETGHFVITSPTSAGPGDQDIVMIRPSALADPDRPGAPPDEQDGDWPLDDIDGWLDALAPGILAGEPGDTTLGGLDAVTFDVALTDEVECGPEFCVGFATNRLVNSMWFDRRIGYRVWWIDGGDEAPIAVNIGDGSDPAFTERAEAVLDTVAFESVGPNPIPAEGNLWELGISSEVPAGTVTLPIGPGVEFEMADPHFIFQRGSRFSGVLGDGPYESDIFFPEATRDGSPVESVDDVVDALEALEDFDTERDGTREVAGIEATVVQIMALDGAEPPSGPLLVEADLNDGWFPPPNGTLWVMETDTGVAVVSAEWFEAGQEEPALALAEEILTTIRFG